MSGVERFFKFARDRHDIYLRRRDGKPRPWTDDPILRDSYFTNVYRELDKTTAWFRDNVRERLRSKPEVLLATVVFRWFNKIDLGELIFCQGDLFSNMTLFESYLDGRFSIDEFKNWIRAKRPHGPYVSGAYIIKAETGMDKLSGVCYCIDKFNKESGWRVMAESMLQSTVSMEGFWTWLKNQYYLGPFTSYEIVCDLRYTDLLCRAPDKLSWANAGPGAMRGLERVYSENPAATRPVKKAHSVEFMRVLLHEAHRRGWTDWEMREVEHTLCEFDKYERVRLGQGRSKRRYRPTL
jgi:hypothetical protein